MVWVSGSLNGKPGGYLKTNAAFLQGQNHVPKGSGVAAKLKNMADGQTKKNNRSLPETPVVPTNSGRHDWIRTNDPHHVKVML